MIGQNLEEGTVPVYGWMVGDLDVAKEAARAELRAAGLSESVGHTRPARRVMFMWRGVSCTLRG